MKKVILRREGRDLVGSYQLAYIDGRFNLQSTINYLLDRNKRFEKNLPHIMADEFYFVDERLKRTSDNIKLE